MALYAAIRDAEQMEPRRVRWGWWHIECLTTVARAHFPAETKDLSLFEVWSYGTLASGLDVQYPMGFKDPYDGEVFILNKGDRIEVWRDR